jgi:hypothetical protein
MKRLTTEEIYRWIADLRHSRRLHTTVENRLAELMGRIAPGYHPIKEPLGLAGGRNDLLLFEFTGRKVLFEVFASRSQVSRDLRILDKTDADIKVAIIVDKEVDSAVLAAFLKENPESNYPFLLISELFEEPPIMCNLKLRELVLGDEEAKFRRMLRARIPREDFFSVCRKEGIEVFSQEDIQAGSLTFAKVLITVTMAKCLKYGVARERVRNLGQWLSTDGLIEFVLRKVSAGMNVILYTDFLENFAVYSDTELVDWIRASYLLPQPYVVISLNAVIAEIDEKYLKGDVKILGDHKPSIYLGSSQVYESTEGKMVVVSLPKDTSSIMMIPPAENTKSAQEIVEMIRVMPAGPVIIQLKPGT